MDCIRCYDLNQQTEINRHFVWQHTGVVYDRVAAMLIAILWGYIFPVAFYPKDGCPNDNRECWDFCGYLFLYIVLATLLLPFLAVATVKNCTGRPNEMENSRENIKQKYYIRTQTLLLASVGTIWSFANSQFAYNVIRQVAYTGCHSYHISSNHLDIMNPNDPTLEKDDGQNIMIDFEGSSLISNGTQFENVSYLILNNSLQLFHSRYLREGIGDVSEVFVESSPALAEMRWGMLASFCFGVGYTGVACFAIAGVSALCQCNTWLISRTPSFPSMSSGDYSNFIQGYFIELGMLLQNNWYYVCGYSWQIFWSYAWFGSSLVAKNYVDPWILLFLDVFRAFLFTCAFSTIAIFVLPKCLVTHQTSSDVELGETDENGETSVFNDTKLSRWTTEEDVIFRNVESMRRKNKVWKRHNQRQSLFAIRSKILKEYDHLSVDDLLLRLVLLVFKSSAVVVSVSLADLPTSFVVSFLADKAVMGLSFKKQLAILAAIAFVGVVVFSVIEVRLSASTPTLSRRFGREVCSWVMAFIVLTPWLRALTIVTGYLMSRNLPSLVIAFILSIFGVLLTVMFAIGSSAIHLVSEIPRDEQNEDGNKQIQGNNRRASHGPISKTKQVAYSPLGCEEEEEEEKGQNQMSTRDDIQRATI